MKQKERITIGELKEADHTIPVGKEYIPDGESYLRRTILGVFSADPQEGEEAATRYELLGEAIFWSLGELINNANKANNRWALLKNALQQRALKADPALDTKKLQKDIDYAIEHSQSDLLVRYNLVNLDLTEAILKLLQMHNTNSFALSERFQKKIEVTLRIRERNSVPILILHVVNNSPITVVDRERVEYNLNKVKEDLMMAGQDPFEAALRLYEKLEDHGGGGFGAGLRSIVLFLKEAYSAFPVDIIYSKLIRYHSTATSTIFSVELPIP